MEARLSETEPILLRPLGGAGPASSGSQFTSASRPSVVAFNRTELREILSVYGRMVAAGEWRDYAIDHGRETACFSVYRRTSECPLYRIFKTPKLARKQGAYSVVTPTGLILKRGNELSRVLAVLERPLRVVDR